MAADEEAYTSENVRRILTLLTSWEKLAYSGAIQLLRRNSFAIQLLLALPIHFWKCSPYFNYTKIQVHFFLKSWQNYVRFCLSEQKILWFSEIWTRTFENTSPPLYQLSYPERMDMVGSGVIELLGWVCFKYSI